MTPSGFCKWDGEDGSSVMLEIERSGFVTVSVLRNPDGQYSMVRVPIASWEAMTRICFERPKDVKTMAQAFREQEGLAIDATGFMTGKDAGLGPNAELAEEIVRLNVERAATPPSTDDGECCGSLGRFSCRQHGLIDEARQFTSKDDYIAHCPACHNWYGQVPGVLSYSGALPIFVHPPEEIAAGRKVWPG